MTQPDAPDSLKPNAFHILLSLADKELHGYGIRAEVLERTEGTVNLWPGVLYRTLGTLVDDGLIVECPAPDSAPADAVERRYYRVTPAGTRALRQEARRMASYVDAAVARAVLPR